MVGDCIEISNPFLKDFEVVILFVVWSESPSLCQREGTEGRECKNNWEVSPPHATKKGETVKFLLLSSGGRTRTSDLRVMSPTSCQLLYPAMYRYMG